MPNDNAILDQALFANYQAGEPFVRPARALEH